MHFSSTLSPRFPPPPTGIRGASFSGPAFTLSLVSDGLPVYRPRHPERTDFYLVLDRHFERYVAIHEERFEPRSGTLRPVVRKTVEAFLDCGRHQNGFARLRCPACRGEHLLAFSCQKRGLCPSCIAKRSALFAEQLVEKVLAPAPHRHLTFTIPKALRGLFERDRRLLSLLVRSAYDAVKTCFQEILGRGDALPGFVAAIQTFGSFAANFHPHLHVLATDGLLAKGGDFIALPSLDQDVLAEMFRRLVLDRLHEAERLSDRFRENLLGWTHSGFHVYAGPPIPLSDSDRLERLARYLTRPPIALGSVSLTPEGQVLVTTPPDPRTGEEARVLDPLDFVHVVTNQIPDRGSHTVRYLGAYANRLRRTHVQRQIEATPTVPAKIPAGSGEEDDTFTRSRRSSWARLLRKVLEVDPMICPRCGSGLKIVAVITDPLTVDTILGHRESGRGHDPFEPRAPPPADTSAA